MEQNLKKHSNFLFMIIPSIIIFIDFLFRINVHTWESYFYSGSIFNFIPTADMIPPVIEGKLPNGFDSNSLICLYYTQHPLLYYLTYAAYHMIGRPNPLIIVQAINILCGGIASYWICRLFYRLSGLRLFSLLATCVVMFSDVYWYQRLSGEVYIASFMCMTISFWYLIEFCESDHRKDLILISIWWGFGMTFHLLAGLFLVPVAYMLYRTNKFTRIFVIGSIAGIFLLIAYVLPYLEFLFSGSYFQLMFLHSYSWGIWQIPISFIPFEIIYSLGIGLIHLLNATIVGNSFVESLFRLCFLFVVFGCLCSYRKIYPRFFKNEIIQQSISLEKTYPTFGYALLETSLVWFFTYFFMITLLIHVPIVNDYWCFNLFGLIFFCLFIVKDYLESWTNPILGLLVVILFFFNFSNDIYPKYKINESDFFILSEPKEQIGSYTDVIFIGENQLLSEAWYIGREYPNIRLRYLHNEHRYANPKEFQEAFFNRIGQNKGKILIISNNDKETFSQQLTNFGFNPKIIFDISHTFNPKIYKTSMGLPSQKVSTNIVGIEICQLR